MFLPVLLCYNLAFCSNLMSVFIDRSLSLGLENTKINTNKIPVAADDHQILINVHGDFRIETNIKQIYSYFENPDSFCKVRNIFLVFRSGSCFLCSSCNVS